MEQSIPAHLLLFGAGASAFGGPCEPFAPPLGEKLFTELCSLGGIAASIEPELASIFEQDFETGMMNLRARDDAKTTHLCREMAGYFTQFQPNPDHCYIKLLRQLLETKASFSLATLNYDLLIECSVIHLGRPGGYDFPPKYPGEITLFKLHGSCNVVPPGGPQQFAGINFDIYTAGVKGIYNGPFEILDQEAARRFCEQASSSPGIAVYGPGKPVLWCANFAEKQQKHWRDHCTTAKSIVVVGTRVVPGDLHVWDPIAESDARVYYVGPDATPFLDWALKRKIHHAQHLASSFESGLDSIVRVMQHSPR